MVRDELQKLAVHKLKATGMRINQLFDNHLETNENYFKRAFKRKP